MTKPTDESPLSAASLLADIDAKLDRTLSTAAQASLQAARTVRLVNANMQLDARNRMALVDTVDKFKRDVQRLGQLVEQMHASGRPSTLTVVADVPAKRDDDITTTVMLGQPWWGVTIGGKRIPSRWVARMVIVLMVASAVMLVLLGMWLKGAGVTPQQVVKTAAPLVAP